MKASIFIVICCFIVVIAASCEGMTIIQSSSELAESSAKKVETSKSLTPKIEVSSANVQGTESLSSQTIQSAAKNSVATREELIPAVNLEAAAPNGVCVKAKKVQCQCQLV